MSSAPKPCQRLLPRLIGSALLLWLLVPRWAAGAADCSKPLDFTGDASRGKCAEGQMEHECGCVTMPHLIKRVEPYYPAAARGLGVKGHVVLLAVIGTDGRVTQVQVTSATPEGRGFEAAAIATIKKWRYEPASLNGKAVAVSFTVEMDFHFD